LAETLELDRHEAMVEAPASDAATTTVVGMAVASLPTPHVPSTLRLCCACGEPIWLSKQSRELWRHVAAGARTLCLDCAYADGLTIEQVLATPRSIDGGGLAPPRSVRRA
jgi:hypothetical protein